ncbi:phosphotransferase family protein [Paenibacillus nasutitermitis]|uniref:Aminoglycoside phosphotransferase n=1 Tax=Paenibacillus nasutitermitis TaxID=1652958 RepID=A0A916YR62_9BACL|nr:aminoglycoside phosphotransferase family protein [Paenibacillus nasutitermitis]GGD55699.1 aminoglycoside phosphotransferase [Paenibacillus nasutitermitis]
MNNNLIEAFKEHIPLLQGCISVEPILKGYSSDNKYLVRMRDDTYLLRSFDLAMLNAKEAEYEALINMMDRGVLCSRPLEFGSLPAHHTGYMVLTYVEGEEASDVLPALSESEQLQIGIAAGQELYKIHEYEAPGDVFPWYDRKMAKHRGYLDKYAASGIKIRNDARLLAFIDDHLELMKNRPNRFQHDDYHVGNLIVKDRRLAGVIDFNRWDWGDPLHDFLKVGMFSAEVSIPFSMGQIRGYHAGREPELDFWRLYSLYLAMCLISSIVWIQQVKPEETDIMMAKINKVMADHDDFGRIIPRWYTGSFDF